MVKNVGTWRLLITALGGAVALPACHGASATYEHAGDAGATDSAAGASGGGNASGGAGTAVASETPEWPMPNAPGLGLPNSESYDDGATAGVVRDLVTGLDWLQAPGTDLYSRADANSYCAALSVGGFEDWRVPTFIELVSLFDAVPHADQALGTSYISTVFQASGAYWTTSSVPAHPDLGRMLDFAADECGTSGVCSIGESAMPENALGGAFCVRSSQVPSPDARYDVESDHVTDLRTGLVWLNLPSAMQSGSYADAVGNCAALGNGARVPSITELMSITVPFLDTSAFKGWPSTNFAWSSSAISAVSGAFWAGAIGGSSQASAPTAINQIECVR